MPNITKVVIGLDIDVVNSFLFEHRVLYTAAIRERVYTNALVSSYLDQGAELTAMNLYLIMSLLSKWHAESRDYIRQPTTSDTSKKRTKGLI